jgi:Ras-related protein Rab-5C
LGQQSSLDKAKQWVKELQRQANENIIIALAGNKLDLVTSHPDKRAIQTADAEAYAREAGLLFFETSAKTSENVRELFTSIAKKLPLDQAGPRNPRAGGRGGVELLEEETGKFEQGRRYREGGITQVEVQLSLRPFIRTSHLGHNGSLVFGLSA